MKEVAKDICSAAVMIYCTRSAMKCTCIIADLSPSASSYRGEILSAILTQLILRAASTGTMGPFPRLNKDCGNNGVVLHGNNFTKPLPASQKQADVLRVMKRLLSGHMFSIKFHYVQSHTDQKYHIPDSYVLFFRITITSSNIGCCWQRYFSIPEISFQKVSHTNSYVTFIFCIIVACSYIT
jgi:hypothetical protein